MWISQKHLPALIALTFFAAPGSVVAKPPAPLPVDALKKRLQQIAKGARAEVAIYVESLETDQVIEINATKPYKAASLIKLPLVVDLFVRLSVHQLSPSRMLKVRGKDVVGGTGILKRRRTPFKMGLKELVELTITKSDNTATNVLIKFATMHSVNRRMKRMGLPSLQLRRKMVQKPPPENWGNARDFGKLMRLIANNTLDTPEGFDPLIEILGRSSKGGKLGGLLPEGTKIARKGGRLPRHIHDAAVLTVNKHRVVLIAMISHFKSRAKAQDAIQQIGLAVYNTLAR